MASGHSTGSNVNDRDRERVSARLCAGNGESIRKQIIESGSVRVGTPGMGMVYRER